LLLLLFLVFGVGTAFSESFEKKKKERRKKKMFFYIYYYYIIILLFHLITFMIEVTSEHDASRHVYLHHDFGVGIAFSKLFEI